MKVNLFDTIAAISTPMGTGGISIIRISGDNAFNIIEKIFKPHKNIKVKEIKSHTINYGHIIQNNQIIDEVMVSFMYAPNTYTKENVAEINCHGGIKSAQSVLTCVVKNGARLAEPGEFTKRAFLNGRIDLSQAEAVIDIINSKTELAQKSAVNRLNGKLAKKVKLHREEILTLIAHIEANIDYPEHEDEFLTYKIIADGVNSSLRDIKHLLSTADTGKIIKEGIKTVILGKPNVGKSSLLNFLLDEERAIVTNIPGTTRDILQESVNINGIALNIIDTAGIRETDDIIEKMGVEKSKEFANDADLVFFIVDGSKQLDSQDLEILEFIKDKKTILIINKIDLELQTDKSELLKYIDENYILEISVKDEIGFESLFKKIEEMFFNEEFNMDEDVYISNERNKQSLNNALVSLENVLSTIENNFPEDFISMDLLEAYRALGEITGESLDEDVIDKIFSEFCLGK